MSGILVIEIMNGHIDVDLSYLLMQLMPRTRLTLLMSQI